MLVPWQIVLIIFTVLVALMLWRVIVWLLIQIVGRLVRLARWLDRRERSPYACPVCGYDIRATPHGCPECGTKLRWGIIDYGRRK